MRRVLSLSLITLALLAAAPALAQRPAAPPVRVHGTATWTPVMDLALDEVALLWSGAPREERTPPVLTAGASLLHADRTSAAIRVSATSPADLVDRARALRDANPQWDVRLVLYTAGKKPSAKTRRLLTEEIAVVAADGSVTRERVTDPLTTLDAALAIARRPGVARTEVVAEAPDYLRQRHARKVAKVQRQDLPDQRQEFFALKRRPLNETRIPVERYFTAREQMRQMPLHSTAGGGVQHPSAAALGMTFDAAAPFLGAWTPLGPGNIGGRTRAIVVDPATPTTIYAGGVAGGVWKTTNGGGTWTPLTDTLLPNLAVASMAMDPTNSSVLYAGTGEGIFNGDAVQGAGIFKTANDGASWTQLASTAPPTSTDFLFVNKLKVLSNGTTLLAATGSGLWRSQNSGTSWTRLIDAYAVNGCFDIALAPTYVLASCGTFAQGTVHRSPSGDATAAFTPVLATASMGRTSIAIAPSNPTIAYALASSTASGPFRLGLDAVYKSMDSGANWTPTVTNTDPTPLNTLLLTNPLFATPDCFGFGTPYNQGWYDNVIAVDPTNPDTVWAGGIDLFRSDDGGLNFALASFWWTDSTPGGAFAHADQHAIVFHPGYNGTTNQTMFIGNDGGIFKTSSARGATTTNVCDPDTPVSLAGRWTELNNNYGVTQFYYGVTYPGPDGGNTFVGGAQDNGTLRGTAAAGIDGWSTLNGGDGGAVAVDPTNANVLYAETTDLSIVKSANGGASFSDAISGISDTGFLFIAPFTLSPNNSQVLWTGGSRMWRTTNGAGAWAAGSTVFGCGSVSAIAVAPDAGAPGGVGNNLVMAGTSGGCVFRTSAATTATGATAWTRVTTAENGGYVSGISFDPSNAANVYVTHSTFGVGHVYKSADAGVSFTNIDGSGVTGLPDVPAFTVAVAPGNGSRLYTGTDVGVFSSDDGGATWAVENSGFANVITESLAVGQVGGADHLFAFTHGRGVFHVALPASLPDLSVTVASVPASTVVAPGAGVAVTNSVRNIGGQPAAGPFDVTFALVPVDSTGTPSGSDVPLSATRTITTLAANATSTATTTVSLPPATTAGSYKIRVIADAAGAITTDTHRTNNDRLTSSLTVSIPDLTVNSVTFTPAAAGAGMNISVTHVLKNVALAPGNAPASVSGIYLAANTSFSTVVSPLGTVTVPALNANATGTALSAAVTRSVAIPPVGVVPPGRYVVLVRANDNNGFVEASTANNVGAAAATLIVGPDLLFTAGSTPTGASPGMNVSASYTVRNQGGVAATFNVGFALVPVTAGGTPTGPDIPVGPNSASITLGAGLTSAALSSNVFLPPDLTPELYRLRFIADPANVVVEADETNNTFLSTTILNVARPDLSVTSVVFTPATSRANGSVTVTHTLRNAAPVPGTAPASISSLFLASVNNSVAGAIALGNASVATIAGASTLTVARAVTIPVGTAPGLYFVLAQADAAGAIVETNESNNLGASATRLVVGPDLSISAASAGTGVAPGTNLSVTYTVKNGGGDVASNFVVGFTLVPVSPPGPDVPLTATRTVATLAAGATLTFTDALLIPGVTAAGLYKVRITADSTGVVTEADETNNALLTANVTVARADLTVSSVTFAPATARANGSVTVTHVVRNLAPVPGTAAPTVSSLFLNSVNASVTGGIFLANVSVPQIAGASLATLATPVTIPLATPIGVYFVLAQADAGATLLEPNESNNLGASATRLIVGPDAVVTAATIASGAAGAAPGTNVSVSYTLRNLGIVATGLFDVTFDVTPVSTAGVPNGAPIPLGTVRSHVSLAAGQTRAFTNNALLPPDLNVGTYRVRVTLSGFSLPDANPADDTLLTSGVLTVFRPDLIVNSVTFTPAALVVGGNLSATHTVRNVTATIGAAPASLSSVFLSTTPSLAGLVFTYPMNISVPALLPAATSAPITTLLPLGATGPALVPGKYFVGYQADGPGLVFEANESNNALFAATPFLVGPDPAVTALTAAPASLVPGANVTVTRTYANLGATATGSFDVAFALVPVNPPGADIPLITVTEPSLAAAGGAAATRAGTTLVTVPSNVAAGQYAIRATLTPSTAEADAGNDTRLSNTFAVVRPDLAITVLTPPATLIAGRTGVSIPTTVRNNAAAPGTASPFEVGLYLSADATIDTLTDTLVGNRSVATLAAGAVSSAPVLITVPATAGNFFLGAVADHRNGVVEGNESNNVMVKPVQIVPDLVRTSVTATVNFTISGGATCAGTILGNGTASETIASQTGGSFSGGRLVFADSAGGVDTLTFSGTVAGTGTVGATFSISRAGGGGGSGSGTLFGTAAVGGGAPGALTLDVLAGTMTISGFGTCNITGQVTYP